MKPGASGIPARPVTALLVVLVGLALSSLPARADDPFADLPSPALPKVPSNQGDPIRISVRPPPEAQEVAPRFPTTPEEPPPAPATEPLHLLRVHTEPGGNNATVKEIPARPAPSPPPAVVVDRPKAAPPPPLPVLTKTGTAASPLPDLVATEAFPWPDVLLTIAAPDVAPGARVTLDVSVMPASGPARVAGVTVTGLTEDSGAVFFQRGDLLTDERGRVRVEVTVPLAEGFQQLHVLAADDDRGVAVTRIRVWVRTPLEIRPELPASLRVEDRFMAAAIVRNRAIGDRTVLVRIRAAGAVVASDPVRVSLAGGEERRIRVKAHTPAVGTAVFQVAAATVGSEHALAHAESEIPVLRSTPVLRDAAYGAVSNALRIPLFHAGDAQTILGDLEVSVAADPRLILHDALLHLLEDDTGGTEPLAGRILALSSLREKLGDISLGHVSLRADADRLLREAVARLLERQRPRGGFGAWARSRTDPLVSAWAAAAMAAALRVNAPVPDEAVQRVTRYLSTVLDNAPADPSGWGTEALVLRSLAYLGTAPSANLDRLYLAASGRLSDTRGTSVSHYAKAWLMEALHALDPSDVRIEELHLQLREAAVERGDGVTFPESMDTTRPDELHTQDRTDAVVLHALLTTRPLDTLIPRIVSGLLGTSVAGHWSTTQVDAWAIQGLARFYDGLSQARPSYEVRAWVGKRMILGRKFRRKGDQATALLPLQEILKAGADAIRIGKRGQGRLFYRLGFASGPAWSETRSANRGLRVERAWSLVDTAGLLRMTGPGHWTVREGERVRVQVRLVVSTSLHRVLVDVPLPSGFVSARPDGTPSTWDNEEATAGGFRLARDDLPPGVYEFTHILRAATPGEFVVPPVRARALYSPGVTGQSAAEVITVAP